MRASTGRYERYQSPLEPVNPTDKAPGQPVFASVMSAPSQSPRVAAIVHRQQLYSDCLTRAIADAIGADVQCFNTLSAWSESEYASNASLVIVNLAGLSHGEEAQYLQSLFATPGRDSIVVLMGDSEEPGYVAGLLNKGAKGYIPTSLPLDLMVRAVLFVLAGGIFIPSTAILAATSGGGAAAAPKPESGTFTARQIAVIEAVCKGKPNKVIAYELNMCESTVKVHVRNIMKKLKAKNRTEVAFLFNQLQRGAA